MHSLPLFHRVAGRAVVVVGEGDTAAAKRRLVERAGGQIVGETEAHHASLAFVALEEPRAAEAAAIRLRCRGLLVNVADRPELCDFTLPSVVERDPVLVAVSTGGASAGLAKALRLRLEGLLPASLGTLAKALHAARGAVRERWPKAAARRRALDAALEEGGPLDPLRDHPADAVERWSNDPEWRERPGERVIRLRSADPDDLTLREARWLGAADTLVHDGDAPAAVLARARADAARRAPDEEVEPGGLVVRLHSPPDT